MVINYFPFDGEDKKRFKAYVKNHFKESELFVIKENADSLVVSSQHAQNLFMLGIMYGMKYKEELNYKYDPQQLNLFQ
jgi:hypothetical protein